MIRNLHIFIKFLIIRIAISAMKRRDIIIICNYVTMSSDMVVEWRVSIFIIPFTIHLSLRHCSRLLDLPFKPILAIILRNDIGHMQDLSAITNPQITFLLM